MKKLTASATPKHLQYFFLTAVYGLSAMGLCEMVYRMLMQYHTNHNLSAYMGMVVSDVLFPVVIVVGSYLLISRNISALQKVYESTVIAVIGSCFLGITNQLYIYLLTILKADNWLWNVYGAFWTWMIMTVPALVIVFTYVLIARSKKRW